MKNKHADGFIPANENKFVIWFFKWYTFFLLKSRFKNVFFRTNYSPKTKDSTLILANHHSWWDGLIPLIINEFEFKQNARAVMEDIQIKKYPFFSRIGAFSINRQNMKSALYSLDYGAEWLKHPKNSLFLYPEGKITSAISPIQVENGFLKVVQQVPDAHIVILTIFISTAHHNKPDLYLDIHGPVQLKDVHDKADSVLFINQLMNERRSTIANESLNIAEIYGYRKLI
ncbi:MAG TPA: hypothetical protein DCE78_01525 [Bacteroidetes bacterium]|nr:hypothetical protein [Bacteroidota bacterium]